ncbi:hypothetical protein FOA52_014210 [Chlamydomonas sp. UWO 241]|nr:hypothetical protein FOA52_014210 [Chlamydomonas sp. UWO 241]
MLSSAPRPSTHTARSSFQNRCLSLICGPSTSPCTAVDEGTLFLRCCGAESGPSPVPPLRAPPVNPFIAAAPYEGRKKLDAMEMDSDDICWICLDDDKSRALVRPCACPRAVHPQCMARWQLQQAGRPEETQCRFCNSVLADWKSSLTPEPLALEVAKVQPIMVVYFEGEIHRIPVRRGNEGLSDFTNRIRDLFRLPEDVDISLTFGCKEPMSGRHLKLEGIGAFDAAVHCASVAAAERQQKIRSSGGGGSDKGSAGGDAADASGTQRGGGGEGSSSSSHEQAEAESSDAATVSGASPFMYGGCPTPDGGPHTGDSSLPLEEQELLQQHFAAAHDGNATYYGGVSTYQTSAGGSPHPPAFTSQFVLPQADMQARQQRKQQETFDYSGDSAPPTPTHEGHSEMQSDFSASSATPGHSRLSAASSMLLLPTISGMTSASRSFGSTLGDLPSFPSAQHSVGQSRMAQLPYGAATAIASPDRHSNGSNSSGGSHRHVVSVEQSAPYTSRRVCRSQSVSDAPHAPPHDEFGHAELGHEVDGTAADARPIADYRSLGALKTSGGGFGSAKPQSHSMEFDGRLATLGRRILSGILRHGPSPAHSRSHGGSGLCHVGSGGGSDGSDAAVRYPAH